MHVRGNIGGYKPFAEGRVTNITQQPTRRVPNTVTIVRKIIIIRILVLKFMVKHIGTRRK